MGGLCTTKVAAKQIKCQCPVLEREILQYTRGSHATHGGHPAQLDGIVRGQTKYRIETVDGPNNIILIICMLVEGPIQVWSTS